MGRRNPEESRLVARHRTVDRIAAILELAASEPEGGVSLGTLAAEIGAPKSSTHGFVSGLVAVGYLVERDRRYVIGPGPKLIFGERSASPVATLAAAELRTLHVATGETALLGVRAGYSIIYTDQVESDHPLRYSAPLFSRRPLFTTSMGRALLADLSEDEVLKLVRGADDDAVDPDALLQELAQIQRRGYALNRGATITGITALGAGVRDSSGQFCAALAVNGPTDRMESRLESYGTLLCEAANRLTDALVADGEQRRPSPLRARRVG